MTPSAARSLFEDDSNEVRRAFGQYELLDRIGIGGFAEVHSCIHAASGALFAIKIIKAENVFDQGVVARFRREVQVLQTVKHPNIIRVHDHNMDTENRLPALVMDLAEISLLQYLENARCNGRARPVLEPAEAAAIFRAILLAVEALHCHNPQVIHRDVNPSNILKMPDGSWVLADFGLAKFIATSQLQSSLTRTRVGLGTAWYAAPEQFDDLKRATAAADIFALGILLWELFANEGPPPEASHLPNVLLTIYSRATRRDPAARYDSVESLRADFENALAKHI